MSKHFYVYYSYEEFGRGYIGSRGCKCLPEEDLRYYGSFHDKTFKPTQKIIIGVYESRKDAYEVEILLHEFYDVARNPHFANRSKQTSLGFTTSGVGRKHTEEHKKKVGDLHRGKVVSVETRKKVSDAHMGKKLTEEHKEKIRQGNLGKKVSEETKQKLREANLGKKLSKEQVEFLRKINLGKPVSKEARRKISEAHKGKIVSEETRRKMSEANKGKVFSEETRKRMSEAAKKRCEKKRLEKLHQDQDTKE